MFCEADYFRRFSAFSVPDARNENIWRRRAAPLAPLRSVLRSVFVTMSDRLYELRRRRYHYWLQLLAWPPAERTQLPEAARSAPIHSLSPSDTIPRSFSFVPRLPFRHNPVSSVSRAFSRSLTVSHRRSEWEGVTGGGVRVGTCEAS